ncbi:MAG: hypothetical protein HAW62_02075 [Endozoicomonadaceae bacterium]|nr:hypothetical protein [Endozoicomonadaceae bacterium]
MHIIHKTLFIILLSLFMLEASLPTLANEKETKNHHQIIYNEKHNTKKMIYKQLYCLSQTPLLIDKQYDFMCIKRYFGRSIHFIWSRVHRAQHH